MFREMRKKNREISNDQCMDIIKKSNYGLLSTIGENGYPYGTALNYVYTNNAIYFHCAREGHKLDNILYNNKVSFLIIDDFTIRPDKFDTLYSSVIIFGKSFNIEGNEKEDALFEIIKKYSPKFIYSGTKYIKNAINNTHIIKIDIEHITGKSSTPHN